LIDVVNSDSNAYLNSLINPITFATNSGFALVPISNNAVMTGLKIANLVGKWFYKAN